ncbi:adrenocortical dysplasia protein homolog isoform X1 [Macrotis lagotis]|uniref:adrenocortical dysplasia protein homolog isoform X1 n=1 Tax=Macrotis lagotis TaxID=92651 RepID=UPI003D68A6A6
MATSWKPVLQPWIRDLLLALDPGEGSGAEGKGAGLGQLLEVIQEAEPGGRPAPGEAAAVLLVTDGSHSVRCLVAPEALRAAAWDERPFGFRRATGRLLLLQDFRVAVQEAAAGSPEPARGREEFCFWVQRFVLLPTELPREGVTSCNRDPAVVRKLQEYRKHQEGKRAPLNQDQSSSLSQLLEEMCEDRRSLLSCQAQSCLQLDSPLRGSLPPTRWEASRSKAQGEVFTVPGLRLQISAEEEDILRNLRAVSENSPELPNLERTPTDPWHLLPALSLERSSSSSSSSYVEALDCLPFPTEEIPRQPKDNFTNSQESPSSSEYREPMDLSPLPSPCIQTAFPQEPPQEQHLPSLPSPPQAAFSISGDKRERPGMSGHQQPLGGLPRTRARGNKDRPGSRKPVLEFVTKRVKGVAQVPESNPGRGPALVRVPPKRHLDDTPFQYNYPEPCVRLCSQVVATRLGPSLLDWARQVLTETDIMEA